MNEAQKKKRIKEVHALSRKRVKEHRALSGGSITSIIDMIEKLGGSATPLELADNLKTTTKSIRRKMQDYGLAKDRCMNLVSPCETKEISLDKVGNKNIYRVKPL